MPRSFDHLGEDLSHPAASYIGVNLSIARFDWVAGETRSWFPGTSSLRPLSRAVSAIRFLDRAERHVAQVEDDAAG